MQIKHRHIVDIFLAGIITYLFVLVLANPDKLYFILDYFDYVKELSNVHLIESIALAAIIYFVALLFMPMAMQISTVIMAYVFGAPIAIVLSFIITILTYSLIFYVSNRWGSKILKHLISLKELVHIRLYLNKLGSLGILIAYIVPFFPTETITYVLGSIKLKYKHFITFASIGLFVNITIIALFSSQINYLSEIFSSWIIYILGALILIYFFRHQIRAYFFGLVIKEFKDMKGLMKIKKISHKHYTDEAKKINIHKHFE